MKRITKFRTSEFVDIDFMTKHLFGCKDLDNLIIKGHLLIEHTLNQFINKSSIAKIDISKSKFTFNNKIEIAEILGLFMNFPELKIQIQLLNKLRNSIAHKLEYDLQILNTFLNSLDLIYSKFLEKIETNDEITISSEKDNFVIKKEFLHFSIAISVLYAEISTCSSDIIVNKIKQDDLKNIKNKKTTPNN